MYSDSVSCNCPCLSNWGHSKIFFTPLKDFTSPPSNSVSLAAQTLHWLKPSMLLELNNKIHHNRNTLLYIFSQTWCSIKFRLTSLHRESYRCFQISFNLIRNISSCSWKLYFQGNSFQNKFRCVMVTNKYSAPENLYVRGACRVFQSKNGHVAPKCSIPGENKQTYKVNLWKSQKLQFL